MLAGAACIKIHGADCLVRAEVCNLHMLSAHADEDEILRWLGRFDTALRMTFATHGEPAASDALRHRTEETLDWPSVVPEHGETWVLA